MTQKGNSMFFIYEIYAYCIWTPRMDTLDDYVRFCVRRVKISE